jgi:hypothetical protein
MKKIKIGFFLILIILTCSNFSNKTKSSIEDKYNLEDPEKIIIKNFENHDVIFLGEPHHVKQHLNFLMGIIPSLYKAGVTNIGYEFLPYDRQSELDKLLNANKFDYAQAKNLVISVYFEWTEMEYIEVLYHVWKLNKSLKSSNKKFRIIGLNNSSYWEKNRQQKWTEKDWANCLVKEVLDKKEKVLVYCGTHHAITKFQQPYYDTETNTFGLARRDRIGHHIYSLIGDRCMTIWLHHLWPDKDYHLTVFPCNGILDSISKVVKKSFAFNTSTSELGELSDSLSIYCKGYDNFKLKLVADVYIVLNPICKSVRNEYFEAVNSSNIDQVNEQTNYFYGWNKMTAKQINDSLRVFYQEGKEIFENIKLKNCY